ncbi:RidA family protein [Mesorhizobium hawassense]|uniref:RidA family protein n=2 Tax=Mesorhizobium hawassense TaxID=1209954 RepID=A0A330HJS0_9HYPH|nr:RidA family protein [Mesorhizobium hawassense]
MTSNGKTYNHGVPWEEAFGVTQGHRADGTIYVSGQFSHDMNGEFVGEGNFETQVRQTLENLDRVLTGFGATKANLAELVCYLTNPKEDFEAFVALYKEYVGPHRPAATLLGVSGLAFPQQLVEIRAVAHAL